MAIVVALISATLTVGPSASATPAEADTSTASPSSSEEVTILGGVWERDHYRNVFDDSAQCTLYGKATVQDPRRQNAGLRFFDCHKHAGERRWSMDLYWLT